MRSKHSESSLAEEALKYATRSAFQKESNAAYQAARRRNLLDKLCTHMEALHEEHTDISLENEALKYSSITEFRKSNKTKYNIALSRGLLPRITEHMSRRYAVYTLKDLEVEAAKYQTRQDFNRGSPKHYKAAHYRDILDRICGHMVLQLKSHTLESIQAEAAKYSTRSSFFRGSPEAYSAALRHKILDDVCTHMKRRATISRPELVAIVALSCLVGKAARKSRTKSREFDAVIEVGDYFIVLEYQGIHHYAPIFGEKRFQQVKNKDQEKLDLIRKMGWLPIIIPAVKDPYDIAEFVYHSVPADVPKAHRLEEIDWTLVFKSTGDRYFRCETDEDLNRIITQCRRIDGSTN